MSQLNPVHNTTSYSLKIHLNIILSSMPGSPQWSLSLRFPYKKNLYTPLPSIRATYPAHLILLENLYFIYVIYTGLFISP
jgi:hypothetical protein